MAEYDQAGDVERGGAPNLGAGNELTAAAKAKNIMMWGAMFLLVGVVGVALGVPGVVAVTRADFPGVPISCYHDNIISIFVTRRAWRPWMSSVGRRSA